MMLVPLLLKIFISIFAGLAGALLGLGGGVFLVPLLVIFLDMPIKFAAGASIIAVVATFSAGASTFLEDHLSNIRLGMFLEVATTIGAVLGALVVTSINDNLLSILFGVSLLYASFSMYKKGKDQNNELILDSNDDLAERLRLGSSYYDKAENREIQYGVTNTFLTLGVSFVAGIASGLLGIGGGGIKVPAMTVISKVPMKVAVATSNFMIGVTAAASAFVYIKNGYCDLFSTAPIVLGILLGATIGSRLTSRISSKFLINIFVIVLLLISVRMIYSGVI